MPLLEFTGVHAYRTVLCVIWASAPFSRALSGKVGAPWTTGMRKTRIRLGRRVRVVQGACENTFVKRNLQLV
ncbi:hypothetical protein FB451DRAFT_1221803 [Mycena latifolia]|nr:hypothetical protein FB451DRAFT_1221803 [Mycena latifolia]